MVIEVVQRENERQRNLGRKEATQDFIVQMLKNKMSEKTIRKITHIDEKELQKIKSKYYN